MPVSERPEYHPVRRDETGPTGTRSPPRKTDRAVILRVHFCLRHGFLVMYATWLPCDVCNMASLCICFCQGHGYEPHSPACRRGRDERGFRRRAANPLHCFDCAHVAICCHVLPYVATFCKHSSLKFIRGNCGTSATTPSGSCEKSWREVRPISLLTFWISEGLTQA